MNTYTHLSSQMSLRSRKHVNGASQQTDTMKVLGIADSLANENNFFLNYREDGDSNFGIYHSADEYYGMVDFDETEHLYDLYCAHANKGGDEYEPFSAQILKEIKDVSSESGKQGDDKQGDDYQTSLYGIQSTGAENLDLENNGLLWLPPNAEVEEYAKEPPFCYDDGDEEDSTGNWGYYRSPSSLSSQDLHQREISNQEKDGVGGHFRSVISQLLRVENLAIEEEKGKESWLEIITALSWEVAALLKPDTSEDGGMDPGAYVKIKCVACGHKTDSTLVKGVVCKKNVAHRRMMTNINKPKLLILGGALEYQRVSTHLASVDNLLRQEMDHLKIVAAKIESHQPNVLLVENSVSRYAQEYLLEKNISLVLKIKKQLLERISRCSGAQIIPSVDHLVSPKLGHCDLFYVEKCFEEHGTAGQGGKQLTKNLMYFKDCPKPLGYTILLKGANGDELKKVKHVVQYGVFVAYHLALETSFLADEGASVPSIPIQPSIPLPDKPSHVKTKALPIFSLPSTEDYPSNYTNEPHHFDNYHGSYAASPSRSETSPLSIKCQSSSTQCTKHPLHIDQFPIAMLSSMQQLSDSDHQYQFPNYDLNHDNAIYDNISPSSKDGEIFLDGSVAPNFMYASDYLEEHVCCKHTSDEDNELVAIGDAQLLTGEVLPPPSEKHSILVSLTTRCVWKGILCQKAHFLQIKYYGSCDKPLGRFLQNDLFDQNYHCHSCEQPSEAHVYCYTHQQGSLTISVTKLVELILPGEKEGKIWMWHRCLRCPRNNGFPPSTQRVAMSHAAWGFSFGKFLDLSFSNHPVASKLSSCGHSLHRDCLRFYGSGRMVACFRYAPINIYSVYLPPTEIEFKYDKQEWIKKEGIEVQNKVSIFFNEVNKSIKQIMEGLQIEPCDGSIKFLEMKRHCEDLERTLATEKEEIEESLKRALNQELKVGVLVVDALELNKLRRQLLFQSYIWDQRLLHVVSLHKNIYREGSSTYAAKFLLTGDANKKNATTSYVVRSNDGTSDLLDGMSGIKNNQGGMSPNKKSSEHVEEKNNAIWGEVLLQTLNATSLEVSESRCAIQKSLSVGQSPLASEFLDSLIATLVGESPSSMKENDSTIAKSPRSGKSTLKGKGKVNTPSSPRFSFSPRNYDNMENSISWLAVPFLNFYRSLNKSPSWSRHKLDSVKGYDPIFIMSFKELESQGGARLLLPLGVNDTTVAIYDDEPSSIITYSLLSPDYHNQIAYDTDAAKKGSDSSHCLEHLDLEIPLDPSAEDSLDPLRIFVSADESILSLSGIRYNLAHDPLFYAKPLHTRVSFSDDGPQGKVNYTVVTYFARRFEALRKICCPSGLDFARSLSRCKKWGAQGGKSNVFFAKTMDDRFILKQVTKTELDSFFQFAPSYFKYLLGTISTGSPTCLAKILGVYQVIKQVKGGKETKMDTLVMENVLYGRNVARLYDLKGSSRSRYNSDSSGENNVLLDQNLLEAMSTSPIFIENNAKRVLERAVWNDTSFLASVDVMDYSLLVGMDEEKELVVGIIDFMRQYTWDKHLETWVKASGILGGTKNASPTVISPIQYKKRFRKAMSTYFIMVPDEWTPNLSDPDEHLFQICEEGARS